MRSQADILTMIDAHRGAFLDFTTEVLLPYVVAFDDARPYLKKGTTAEQWEEAREKSHDKTAIKAALADYMAFAWGKAEDHRGLSAGRSVDKCSAWAWLLGADLKTIEDAPYTQYGAPKLAAICRMFDLPIPADSTIQNMINGDLCEPGCQSGCGR